MTFRCTSNLHHQHRYAVIGAGFAGLALRCSRSKQKTHVTLIDFIGVGGGASSVAAGLLHPYNPRGKARQEAFSEVREMLVVAEDVANRTNLRPLCSPGGLLFEARSDQQLRSFRSVQDSAGIIKINQSRAMDYLPGLGTQRIQATDEFYGLFIPQGLVINPIDYMKSLWIACQASNECVTSLDEFRNNRGPFDAIVITAGAAIGCIQELTNKLPIRLCQGAIISLRPCDKSSTAFNGPSLLGPIYLAGQGQDKVVVGATKEYGLSDSQAMQELIRNAHKSWNEDYINSVRSYLHQEGTAIWEPLSKWTFHELKTGVRALPPKTERGALPLMGHLDPDIWILTGLGSRGVLKIACLRTVGTTRSRHNVAQIAVSVSSRYVARSAKKMNLVEELDFEFQYPSEEASEIRIDDRDHIDQVDAWYIPKSPKLDFESDSFRETKVAKIATRIDALADHEPIKKVLHWTKLTASGLYVLLSILDWQGKRYRALEAFRYYQSVDRKIVNGNRILFLTLMTMFSRTKKDAFLALRLFREMKKSNVELDRYAFNVAIYACAKTGDVQQVFSIFDEMQKMRIRPNVITYTSLISACSIGNNAVRALEVFQQMKESGIEINVITYTTLMGCLQKAGKWEEALILFKEMEINGIAPDLRAFNALISALGKAGSWEKAWSVFQAMDRLGIKPDTISFNSLINACEKSGEYERAQEVFKKMLLKSKEQDSKIRPNAITFNSMISACAKKQKAKEAILLLRSMQQRKIKVDVVTLSSLVHVCDNPQHFAIGILIFRELTSQRLVVPNLISYNSYISCLGRAGNWKLAIQTFEQLIEEGLKPDLIVYSTVISACCRNNQVEAALMIYMKMQEEEKIKPNSYIYIALIDACERTGQWEKALELLNTMVRENGNKNSTVIVAKRILYFWPQVADRLPPQIVEAATATIDSGRAARKWVSRI
eukprot:g3537.t1